MKIFSTYNLNTVYQCQYFTGYMPVEDMVRLRKVSFIKSLSTTKNVLLRALYELFATRELLPISLHYGADLSQKYVNCRSVILKHIASKVDEM
jgi:hypothetical protein